MEVISSVANERVRQAKALYDKRMRDERGLLLIEGPRFITEAVAAGARVHTCFYVPDTLPAGYGKLLDNLSTSGAMLVPVTAKVMAGLANTTTPQGMVAVANIPKRYGPEILAPGGLVLVVDQVRDPGNLGTLLRTAAAVGARVVLLAGATDPTGPKVMRSSAGACYAVPMWVGPSADEALASLQAAHYQVVVLEMHGQTSLFATDLRGSIAIVVGNEGHGPDPVWSSSHTRLVHIPMPGRADSLNAGVAASVVLYEALRQRSSGC